MTARPPLPPRDTLRIHCVSCGRFLQSWLRLEVWRASGQLAAPPATVHKVGKGVLFLNGAKNSENVAMRHVLQHRCRAHNNRFMSTVVTVAKVTKLMDERTRRVDW